MRVEMTSMVPRAAALALSALACFAGSGCGGDSSSAATAADAGASKPEAVTTTEVTETAKPAEPKSLELLKGGNPTVFVRIGKVVDLYDEPGGKVVQRIGHATQFGSRTVFSVSQKKGDWVSVLTPYTENGQPLWLKLDPKRLQAGRSEWSIDVDLSEYSVRLYDKGKVVRSFQVSIGMPTAPTPTGRFAITDTFRGGLNVAYGCCALATTARQVNLPSGWLGGDRIAIHGTTGPLGARSRTAASARADEDVSALVDKVPPGTPIDDPPVGGLSALAELSLEDLARCVPRQLVDEVDVARHLVAGEVLLHVAA